MVSILHFINLFLKVEMFNYFLKGDGQGVETPYSIQNQMILVKGCTVLRNEKVSLIMEVVIGYLMKKGIDFSNRITVSKLCIDGSVRTS